MGQQQLLFLILGVIIVGIAVGVGVTEFNGQNEIANKDGVTSALSTLSANAYQFKIRPTILGGGSNSYVGYVVPSKMTSDLNGMYVILGSPSPKLIELQATSKLNNSWLATCLVDSTGKTTLSYSGW